MESYKYRAINHQTTEACECNNFKTLYQCAMYLAKENALDGMASFIEIQCDGVHKYSIYTTAWTYGEDKWMTIETVNRNTGRWLPLKTITRR